MISVKDKDISIKRQAFRETINMHKRFASTHKNAIFSSTTDRFPRHHTIDITSKGNPVDAIMHNTSRSRDFNINASEIIL